VGLAALSPIDRAALRINGKGDYPPLHLRRHSGPLVAFDRAASEFVGYLAALTDLGPSSNVLDMGCGSGALAIMLRERLVDGSYRGFDVHEPSVRWARSHLGDDRFAFQSFDYWNATYNPPGQRHLPWPVDNDWADVTLLKSVFTHMLPEDVAFYLSELARTLRPGGRAITTAFTFDAVDDEVRERFPHEGEGYRYLRSTSPESAIAFPREWLVDSARAAGLVPTMYLGYWRRQQERPLAYQDVMALSADSSALPT
jgi:SAM-dependent methyltransferase